MLDRIYQKVQSSKFDFDGWNLNWKINFGADERILLRQFVYKCAPQFRELEDFKVDEICQKLTAKKYLPGLVLNGKGKKPSGVWFIL
jgi:hypothetical protein